MQRTNIYLAEAQITALDSIADGRGVSRAEVIRELIGRGLEASDLAGLDEDLAAIGRSFGVCGELDQSVARRGTTARDRHLDAIRSS